MEFSFLTILILAAVFVAGAFLGVLLGRRSKTANKFVNDLQAGFDREREELRQQIRNLQSKVRSDK